MKLFLLPFLMLPLLCNNIYGLHDTKQDQSNTYIPASRRLQAFNGDCTAVVKTIMYPPGGWNGTDRKLQLVCQYKGKLYTIPETDEDFIIKNFIDGPFVSGGTKIHIGSSAKIDLDSLDLVTSDSIKVADFSQSTKLVIPRSTGNKNVLIVKVVASGGQNSLSEFELRDGILGSAGDSVNLKSQFSACSHGKLNLQARGNLSGKTTSISDGVVTISVGTSVSEGEAKLVDAVSSELYNQFDDYYYNLADYVLYCMPPDVMVGAGGALVGGSLSVYNDFWSIMISILMHEIGHNLGFWHSGIGDDEYADQSCYMGGGDTSNDYPQMCFNAAKLWQVGWFSARSLTISSSGILKYIGNLADMTQNPDDSSGPPIVIKLQTSSNTDYFISYNRAVGFNAEVLEGRDEVRIVWTSNENSQSWLAASLSAGGTWTSANEFGNQSVEVKLNSIGTFASVSICIGSCNSTPSPTPSPVQAPSDCIDSNLRFLVNGKLRACSWVANKNTSLRCGKAQGRVAGHCPLTCGQCDTLRCTDAGQRFALKENGNLKSCSWVRRLDTEARCNKIDVNTVCRATCTSTLCPNSCVDSPSYWHASDGEEYNCAWYGQSSEYCELYGDGYANYGKIANEACCVCGGGYSFCADSPEGWYDSGGEEYNCEWYAQDIENCKQYGDTFENFGKTANEVCCTCGGGDSY